MKVDRQSRKLGQGSVVVDRSLEPTCLGSSPHCKNCQKYTKTAKSVGASCLDVGLAGVVGSYLPPTDFP